MLSVLVEMFSVVVVVVFSYTVYNLCNFNIVVLCIFDIVKLYLLNSVTTTPWDVRHLSYQLSKRTWGNGRR